MNAANETEVVDADDLDLALLDDKTEVVVLADVASTASRDQVESVVSRGLRVVKRAVKRVATAVGALVRAARTASARDVVRYARRYRRRDAARARIGRHRAQRRWFGRQRSTSERCVANAAERRRAAKEADLPRCPAEFVSWIENAIETLRYEYEVLHPAQPTGRHFVCS